jgi:hypothetical protein
LVLGGLRHRATEGEDWGRVCVHVDNFLFASWDATLQTRFNDWLKGIKGMSKHTLAGAGVGMQAGRQASTHARTHVRTHARTHARTQADPMILCWIAQIWCTCFTPVCSPAGHGRNWRTWACTSGVPWLAP